MKYRILIAATALFTVLAAPYVFAQEEGEAAEKPDETVTVTATEFKFSPDEIEVQSGQTIEVKLVNEGEVAHSYDIRKLDIQSEKVLPGESTTVTVTPEEPGKIEFVCDVPGHEQVGMKGTLVVEE